MGRETFTVVPRPISSLEKLTNNLKQQLKPAL